MHCIMKSLRAFSSVSGPALNLFYACRTPWVLPMDVKARQRADGAKRQFAAGGGLHSDHLALIEVCRAAAWQHIRSMLLILACCLIWSCGKKKEFVVSLKQLQSP